MTTPTQDILDGITADIELLRMAVEADDPKAELRNRLDDVRSAIGRCRATLTKSSPVEAVAVRFGESAMACTSTGAAMSAPYPNAAMDVVVKLLMNEWRLSREQIANLAADIPGECAKSGCKQFENNWCSCSNDCALVQS
ncbi:hypothetical protein [Mesorhizobium sp. M0768]|uniref:hypothetical protein n=1 Tax=Mesorhizobium sp. M0768 TaxID=2956996 RepID=UPI00333916E6